MIFREKAMVTKLIRLALVAGVFSAILVPSAQANIRLFDGSGVTPSAGSSFTMTSEDFAMTFNSETTLACDHVRMSGLFTGAGKTVVGFFGSGEATECAINGVIPATVTEVAQSAEFEESGEGVLSFSFLLDIPLLGLNGCVVEGEAGLNWTLNTDVIHLAGGPLLGTGSEGCPAGAEEVHGTFTVDAFDGDPIYRVEP